MWTMEQIYSNYSDLSLVGCIALHNGFGYMTPIQIRYIIDRRSLTLCESSTVSSSCMNVKIGGMNNLGNYLDCLSA